MLPQLSQKPHFTDEEKEALRGSVTYPRSCQAWQVKPEMAGVEVLSVPLLEPLWQSWKRDYRNFQRVFSPPHPTPLTLSRGSMFICFIDLGFCLRFSLENSPPWQTTSSTTKRTTLMTTPHLWLDLRLGGMTWFFLLSLQGCGVWPVRLRKRIRCPCMGYVIHT